MYKVNIMANKFITMMPIGSTIVAKRISDIAIKISLTKVDLLHLI